MIDPNLDWKFPFKRAFLNLKESVNSELPMSTHHLLHQKYYFKLQCKQSCTKNWSARGKGAKNSMTSSIFINNNLLILHKYCQMAPPHKIDASNDASTSFSFSSRLLFFSDCYCSDWSNEWKCSLFLLPQRYFLLIWMEKDFCADKIWTLDLPI